MTMTSTARIGDLLHGLTVVFTITYAVCVVTFADGMDVQLFDEEWTQKGFCISNPNLQYWTSHDLSFYANALLTMAMLGLYLLWRKEPNFKEADTILGHGFATLGHGMAHFAIAKHLRNDTFEDTRGNSLKFGAVMICLIWFPYLKAAWRQLPWIVPLVSSVLVQIGLHQLPSQYGFSYISTVIMVVTEVAELAKPTKEKQDPKYAVAPMLSSVPLSITPWIEATLCKAFLKPIGGHVWYDLTLGLCLMAVYTLCYLDCRSKNKKLA